MSQDDIFDHGMSGYEFAVLVDHPDAHFNGVQGRSESDRLTGYVDFTFVGLIFPEQDFHQGSLARAILPQDSVNLASFDREVYVVIGEDPRESLRDPPCF
jgi:hypothetical protein